MIRALARSTIGLRAGPVDDLSSDTNELSVDGPDYIRPAVGGFLGATEATREVAVDNWLAGPLLTAAAVFVIAALIFRSVVVSVILMVMLFITLYAQYGLGGYMTRVENWSGNLAFHLQVALSIAMGLGIDLRHLYDLAIAARRCRPPQANWEQVVGEHAQHDRIGGDHLGDRAVGLFYPGCSIPTWPIPGGLGVYISEALLIDVVTALTLLPLLVKWLRPKFVFGV